MTTRYRLGELMIEPASRHLVDGHGRDLSLEPLVFDLLVHMVANADRVVTKEELWRDVWGERPVSESVIPHAVSKLRKILAPHIGGDTVSVVHGRGYRLAIQPEPVATDAGRVSRRGRNRIRLALGAVVLVALAGLVAGLLHVRDVDAEAPRIAVLPVGNETGQPGLDWTRLGLLPLIEDTFSAAGADMVPTATTLSTLQRYPEATDPPAQARRVAASTGAQRVLSARLTRAGDGYLFTLATVDGRAMPEIRLAGTDLPTLAMEAARSAAERIGAIAGATGYRPALTRDPFINEAFARGLDARLRGDPEAAGRYFATVLDAEPELDYAVYQLSLVSRARGEWERTRELLETLAQRARDKGDRRMQANAWSGLGILDWYQGDLDAAERNYRRALTVYRELGLTRNAAALEVNLGILAGNRGDYDKAEQAFTSSLALWESAGDRYNQARTLKNLGVLGLDRDRLGNARTYLEKSLALRRELELDHEVAMTLSALADVESVRGNFIEVAALLEQVLVSARTSDDPALETVALTDLSKALLELGRASEALEHAADALAVARTLGSPTREASAITQLARAHQASGRGSRARELFEQALAMHADSGRRPSELALHIELAGLGLDQGDQALFTTHRETARALAADLDIAGYKADLLRLNARRAQDNGRTAEALATYRNALEQARSAGLRVLSQRIAAELGMALLTMDDQADALRNLAEYLTASPVRTREALAFLAALKARQGDFGQAARLAEEGRDIAGELWTPEDEARLRDYLSSATDPDATNG